MPTTRKKPKTTSPKPASGSKGGFRAKVRMYRQGLGDCFLITLPRQDSKSYFVLIDCGVILGTPNATAEMQKVVNDIIRTTNGHVDLLLATHEHWDHLSGFVQARDTFSGLTVDRVWLGWTEDPDDPLAQKLRSEHQKLRMQLASACARMRFGGGGGSIADGLLEFFGAAGQGTTTAALSFVKGLGKKDIRFCLPTDPPTELPGVDARLYILGPPHDEKMIKRCNPSKAEPETYGMAAMEQVAPGLTDADEGAPFDPIARIPLEVATQLAFFQAHYWGEDTDSDEKDQSWRRIDGDWLDVSSSLALQLDSATNNTSLVLAIELADGDVLLFAADAQVGNWLSWQSLSWELNGKTVSGPDLLSRTILYKTGHHGSHNATLREKGLEMMTKLETALIPVDHAMAVKKHWGKMPLDALEKRMEEMTEGCVLRIDKEVPPALASQVVDPESKLYYEVTLYCPESEDT
jgi:hypothetical protein